MNADFDAELAAIVARGDTDGLFQRAVTGSGATRRQALLVLAGLSGKSADAGVTAAERLLASTNSVERSVAAEVLGLLASSGNKNAQKVVAASRENPSTRVRAGLVAGGQAAFAISALDDASVAVRAGAARRLALLGASADGADAGIAALLTSAFTEPRMAGLEAAARVSPGSASIDLLEKAAREGSRSQRRRVVRLASAQRATVKADAPAAGALSSLLARLAADSCPLVRREAAAALGADHLPTLAQILTRDIDAETRRAALLAAAKIDGDAAQGLVSRALIDSDAEVRAEAERLAGERKSSTGATRARLHARGEAWEACIALGAEAIPVLLEAAEGKLDGVQAGATKRDLEARLAAMEALRRVGHAGAVPDIAPRLVSLASDSDGRIRARALSVLDGLGAHDALPVAMSSLSDREPAVRSVALAAMAGLATRGKEHAAAVAAAERALDDPEDDVRSAAVRALGRLGAIETLGRLAKASEARVRSEALLFIGSASGASRAAALAIAVGALGDELPAVRQAAERATRALGWLPVGVPDRGGRGYARWLRPEDLGAKSGEPVEAVLTLGLDHADAGHRVGSLDAIGAERLASTLPSVLRRLEDAEPSVRLAAARAAAHLGQTPGGGAAWAAWHVASGAFDTAAALGAVAVDSIAEATREGHPALRRSAALALGKTGALGAVAHIERTLGDDAAAVRVAGLEALHALARSGVAIHESPLRRAVLGLDDPDKAVRGAARQALVGLPGALDHVRAVWTKAGPSPVGPLGRELAAHVLADIDDRPDGLVEAAGDEAPGVRAAAALSLGVWASRTRKKVDIGLLIGLLGEADPGVVRAARGALEAVGAVVPPSALALSEALMLDRWQALDTVVEADAPVLLAALSDRARDPLTNARRTRIARSLEKITTPAARIALERVLADVIPTVRLAAAGALAVHAAPESIEALRIAVDHPDRQLGAAAVSTLQAIGQTHAKARPAVMAAVRDALDAPAPNVRAAAAVASGALGDAESASILVARLDDTDAEVRTHAEAALVMLGDLAAEAFLAGYRSGSPRLLARRVLATLIAAAAARGHSGARDALRDALDDDDSSVRRIAADAIGVARTTSATPGLLLRRFDPDSDVRAAVFKALEKLACSPAVLMGAAADPSAGVRGTAQANDHVLAAAAALSTGDTTLALPLATVGEALTLQTVMVGRLGPELRGALCETLKGAQIPGAPEALIQLAETFGVDESIAIGALRGLAHPIASPVFDRVIALARRGKGDIRGAAVRALGGIDTKRARPTVATLTDDGDPVVRAAAIATAAVVGDASALTRGLHDAVPAVRVATLRAIAAVNDITSIAAVLDAADDSDAEVRAAVEETAIGLAPSAQKELEQLALLGRSGLIRRLATSRLQAGASPAVRAALRDPDVSVRIAAAGRLVAARGTDTKPLDDATFAALTPLLGDDDAGLRAIVVQVIASRAEGGRSKNPSGVESREAQALMAGVADPDATVRAAAAAGLRGLGVALPADVAAASTSLVDRGDAEGVLALSSNNVPLLSSLIRVHRGFLAAKLRAVGVLSAIPSAPSAYALAYAVENRFAEVALSAARSLIEHPEAGVAADVLAVATEAGPPERRGLALEALAAGAPRRAVPIALSLLSHGEPTIRVSACRALERAAGFPDTPMKGVEPAIVARLTDGTAQVRAAAAAMLGAIIFGADATTGILALTTDPEVSVRDAAAETLSRRAEAVRKPLETRLRSGDAVMRRTIIRALRRDAPSASLIAEYVGDSDAPVRHAAISAVTDLGHTPAIPDIEPALIDTDADVRAIAAVAIGVLGAKAGAAPAEALLSGLADRDARVRIATAEALRRLRTAKIEAGDPTRLEPFAQDVRERRWARLGEVVAHGGAALVARALDLDTTGGREWRAQLATALAGRLEATAIAALARALTDRDPRLRAAAAGALAHAGGFPALHALERATRDPETAVRIAAIGAVAAAGMRRPWGQETKPEGTLPDSALAALLHALNDAIAEVAIASCDAIATTGAQKAEPALLARLEDPTIADAAARALGKLCAVRSLSTVVAAESATLRRAAGSGLGVAAAESDKGATEATPWLLRLTEDTDMDTRAIAAEGLRTDLSTPSRARAEVLGLTDREAPVRAAAIRALARAWVRDPKRHRSEAILAALADRDFSVIAAARSALAADDTLRLAPDYLTARTAHLIAPAGADGLPILVRAAEDGSFGRDDGPRRASAARGLAALAQRTPSLRAQATASLVRVVAGDDPVAIVAAAQALGSIDATDALEALAQAFQDSAGDVRRALAAVLAGLGAGSALEVARRDPDPVVRATAALGLTDVISLTELLEDASLQVADAAGERLAALGMQEPLVAALSSPSVPARLGAVLGLRGLGSSASPAAKRKTANKTLYEGLRSALSDAAPAVRARALQAVGATLDADSLDAVVEQLETDTEDAVRLSAVGVAAQLGAGNDVLERALVDASGDVIRAARAALEARGVAPTPIAEAASRKVVREQFAELAELGTPALPFCRRILRETWTDRASTRRRTGVTTALGALWAAAETKDSGDVIALLDLAMADKAQRVRESLAGALGRRPGSESLVRLDALAKDPAPGVRIAAARGFGLHGGPEVVDRLAILMRDAEAEVRMTAAVALAGPKTSAVAKVSELLLDRDPEVKIKAAALLVEMGHPDAIEPLIVALGDADARVRLHMRMALRALGFTPVGHRSSAAAKGFAFWTSRAEWVSKVPESALKSEAAKARGPAEPGAAPGQALEHARERLGLEAGLSHPDETVRRNAAEGLETLADPASAPALAKALIDGSADVRRTASGALAALAGGGVGQGPLHAAGLAALGLRGQDIARVLAMTGDVPAAAALGGDAAPALIDLVGAGYPDEQAEAADALGLLAGSSKIPGSARTALEGILGSTAAVVRLAGARALGRLGEDAAVPALEALLDDSDRDVSAEAGRALAALGAAELLVGSLAAESERIRLGAAQGLVASASNAKAVDTAVEAAALERLEAEPSEAVRAALVTVLAAHPGANASTALLESLASDAGGPVRTAAATGLRASKAAGVQQALSSALGDPVDSVREAALASLVELGQRPEAGALGLAFAVASGDFQSALRAGEDAVPLLGRVLRAVGVDGDAARRRVGALEALGTIGSPSALLAARPAFSDAAAIVRATAARLAPQAIRGGSDVLAPLRTLLADPAAIVRRSTVMALGVLVDRDSREAMARLAMDDPDHRVRLAAAMALANPEMAVLDPLLGSIRSADSDVRIDSARALGRSQLSGAIDRLVEALADSVSLVRLAAKEALEALGYSPVGVPETLSSSRISRWIGWTELADLAGAPPAGGHIEGADAIRAQQVEWLAQLTTHASPRNRIAALSALPLPLIDVPATLDSPAVAALAASLDDTIPWVRRTAALRLAPWTDAILAAHGLGPTQIATVRVESGQIDRAGELGESALQPLIRALGAATDPAERAAAATALTGNATAADPLVQALGDTSSDVRLAAAAALGSLSTPAEHEHVIAALAAAMADTVVEVRDVAAISLGQLGAEAALIVSLGHPSPEVRAAAAGGIGAMAGDATDATSALIQALDDDAITVRAAAARALAHGPGDADAALLGALAADPSPDVRAEAARALGFRGAPEHHPALESALADEDGKVRAAAAAALHATGWTAGDDLGLALLAISAGDFGAAVAAGPAAIPLLERILFGVGGDSDTIDRKRRALDAIVAIGSPAAGTSVAIALRDVSSRVREAAVRAVAKVGHVESEDVVVALADNDSNERVRGAAASTIGVLCFESGFGVLERLARSDPSAMVRLTAATALASPRILSLGLLIEQLKSPLADVRAEAASSLGATGRRDAVEPLIGALSDLSAPVRLAARDALKGVGWMPVGLRSNLESTAFGRWLTPADLVPEGLPDRAPFTSALHLGLRTALLSGESTWRLSALDALLDLRDSFSLSVPVENVVPLLEDPAPAIRTAAGRVLDAAELPVESQRSALTALGRFEEAAALGADVALIRESSAPLSPEARARLVVALGHPALDPSEAWLSTVLGALDHDSPAVRTAAAQAITRRLVDAAEAVPASEPAAPTSDPVSTPEPEPEPTEPEPEPVAKPKGKRSNKKEDPG